MIKLQCADCGEVTSGWRTHTHDGRPPRSWTQPENHRISQESENVKKNLGAISVPGTTNQEEKAS